jgi:hypothetical protein
VNNLPRNHDILPHERERKNSSLDCQRARALDDDLGRVLQPGAAGLHSPSIVESVSIAKAVAASDAVGISVRSRAALVQIHAKCRPIPSADQRPLEALLAKHGRVVRRQR